MSNTAPATDATSTALAAAVRRRQNLQVAGTFAGLVALVLVLNLTPLPLWVEWIGFDRHTPASLLGEAYWDDCLGGPLGDFAAGPLPRPGSLSYAPEAGAFLAELEKAAAREEAANAAEAAGDGAAEDDAAEDEPAEGSAEAAE
ncbi:hypothetical protein [Adlercreutzia equolifaciens]|uniref:hypothetical protein n=1 Tax=Adlercreutzia equolifaciens TaxID=446660 RepID=UPI0027B94EEB|nr:hypothetical protein [Adlercreutzia equolifaciens]